MCIDVPRDSEEEIVAKIRAGLADVERGDTVPHEQVMAELEEIIAAAEKGTKP